MFVRLLENTFEEERVIEAGLDPPQHFYNQKRRCRYE